jgi:hypothetical protein
VTFPGAIHACAQLRNHFDLGLGALGADRVRVAIRNTRLISGSVNIENAQKETAGHANAWDYGIGISATDDDKVVWLEVHSANSLHVQTVLDKLDSLLTLLKNYAPDLNLLPRRFVWLATGAVYIPPNSRERRRLELHKLLLRSKRVDLDSVW